MGVLYWGKYERNINGPDAERWEANFAGSKSDDLRVEIHKQFTQESGAVGIIVVRGNGVQITLDGKAGFTWEDWDEFILAVREARNEILMDAMSSLKGKLPDGLTHSEVL